MSQCPTTQSSNLSNHANSSSHQGDGTSITDDQLASSTADLPPQRANPRRSLRRLPTGFAEQGLMRSRFGPWEVPTIENKISDGASGYDPRGSSTSSTRSPGDSTDLGSIFDAENLGSTITSVGTAFTAGGGSDAEHNDDMGEQQSTPGSLGADTDNGNTQQEGGTGQSL